MQHLQLERRSAQQRIIKISLDALGCTLIGTNPDSVKLLAPATRAHIKPTTVQSLFFTLPYGQCLLQALQGETWAIRVQFIRHSHGYRSGAAPPIDDGVSDTFVAITCFGSRVSALAACKTLAPEKHTLGAVNGWIAIRNQLEADEIALSQPLNAVQSPFSLQTPR